MNDRHRTPNPPDPVPLAPEFADRVHQQVTRFVEGLLDEDVQGDAFRAKLDSAFHLGREEIAVTSALLNGRFMTQSLGAINDSPAITAVATLRRHLDELNPGNHGDLLSPHKILGIIPFGSRLRSYLRRFQSAGQQLTAAVQQIYAACDELARDGVEIDACRAKLWDAMQKLKAAIRFAEEVDSRLAAKIDALKASDPPRAHALEQEVLFYVRQNLTDMRTQQAVCTNGYLSLDVLRRTCRETIAGCNRVATTGMSALSVAHTVACATGGQIRTMNMLTGVNATIETLLVASGKELGAHAERTAKFASNPLLAIDKLKETFDLTFKAMDEMDGFRTNALKAMAQHGAALREQLERANTYLDRERRDRARAVVSASIPGPVAL